MKKYLPMLGAGALSVLLLLGGMFLGVQISQQPSSNFYLFLNGDKTSEDWILCNIYRIQGNLTSYVMGENPVIASFSPGALLPNNCDSIRLEHILYYDGADLEAGTYTGTIYYTIGLE